MSTKTYINKTITEEFGKFSVNRTRTTEGHESISIRSDTAGSLNTVISFESKDYENEARLVAQALLKMCDDKCEIN